MKIKTNSKTNITIAPFKFKDIIQVEINGQGQSNERELPKNAFCVNNSAVPGNATYIALAYYDGDNVRQVLDPFYCVSLQNDKMVAYPYSNLTTPVIATNIKKICAFEKLNLGQQFINIYRVGD